MPGGPPLYMFDSGTLGLGGVEVPVPFFLIRHPQGDVLVDGGNPLAVARDPHAHWGALADRFDVHMTEEQHCVAQLRRLGVEPDSVGHVVPGPDGRYVYTGSGVYTSEVKAVGDRGAPGTAMAALPAVQGDLYLGLKGDRFGEGPLSTSLHLAGETETTQATATLAGIGVNAGAIPEVGDKFHVNGWTFAVHSKEGPRLDRVKVVKPKVEKKEAVEGLPLIPPRPSPARR